jgi:hypothetical protein
MKCPQYEHFHGISMTENKNIEGFISMMFVVLYLPDYPEYDGGGVLVHG